MELLQSRRPQLHAFLEGRAHPSRVFLDHSSIKILVVDDEKGARTGLQMILSRWNYQVDTAQDGNSAMVKIPSFRPDIVIADMLMPGMSGLELLEKVHAKYPYIGFFILTGHASIGYAVDAHEAWSYGLQFQANRFLCTQGRSASLS